MSEPSIVMERPTETNNPTSSSNNLIDSGWVDRIRPSYMGIPWIDNNNPGSDSNDGSRYLAPASPSIIEPTPGLFSSGFSRPMYGLDDSVLRSPSTEAVAAETNNQGSDSNDAYPYLAMNSQITQGLLSEGTPLMLPTVAPTVTDNYQRFASNDGSPYMALILQTLTDSFLCSLPVGFRRWLVGQTPVRQRLEMVTVLQNLLNVVANHAAITNNQGLIDLLLRRLPASFLRQTYDGYRYMAPTLPSIDEPIPRLFPSGSSRPTVALDAVSAILDHLTDMDNYQRSDSNDGFDDPIPRRFPSGSSRPTVALDVELAISDDMNVPVDQPAEINNQRPFMSMSNVYRLLGSAMNTGSAVNLLILALFAFTEIKSQGDTEFPFQTHPHITRVAIDSMPLYGLLFLAEHVISAAGPGPDSVYASIARAGRKLCLCILVASLASLFYF